MMGLHIMHREGCALTSDKTMDAGGGAAAASGCLGASTAPATLPAGGAAEVAGASVADACSGSPGNLADGKVALLRVFGDSASSASALKHQFKSKSKQLECNVLHFRSST